MAFLVFAMLLGEAHEIAHFLSGKMFCGCWPESRDFNAWSLCDCALGHFATIAGPLFSMTLAWIGMVWLRSKNERMQSVGFTLIWGNVPQARIMTVLMGGGDEKVFFREILRGTAIQDHYLLMATILVLLLALPPIVWSFLAVKNKHSWLYNFGFMILPLLILGSYGFLLLNNLLERGFLSQVWIMGTPLFITLHTSIMLIILLVLLRKDLFTLVRDNDRTLYS
jgi:hypothetical protein